MHNNAKRISIIETVMSRISTIVRIFANGLQYKIGCKDTNNCVNTKVLKL
jgi:hypothetical protein